MLVRLATGDPEDGFDALEANSGCSLLDRLIDGDYRRADVTTLTLDSTMATLPQARRL